MRFPLSFPLLLAGLLLAAPAATQESPPDTTAVRFHFAWPAGTRARVETTRIRARDSGGVGDTMEVTLRCEMRVLSHPEGLLIEYNHFEFPEPPEGERARQIQQVMQGLSSLSPSIVVSGAGEMIRLDRPDRLAARLDSLLAPVFGTLEDAPPQIRSLVESALSESTLASGAAQEWNALVGSWAGAEFTPGNSYTLSSNEPIPLLGGVIVPMTYEFALVGHGPCRDGEDPAGCVMVTLQSYPDPEAMRKAVGDFMEKITPGTVPGRVVFKSLDTSTHLSVVMSPATMLPHRVELTRGVEGTIAVPEGQETDFQQVDARITTYTYEK